MEKNPGEIQTLQKPIDATFLLSEIQKLNEQCKDLMKEDNSKQIGPKTYSNSSKVLMSQRDWEKHELKKLSNTISQKVDLRTNKIMEMILPLKPTPTNDHLVNMTKNFNQGAPLSKLNKNSQLRIQEARTDSSREQYYLKKYEQEIKKMREQFDRALYDKEKQIIQKINQKKVNGIQPEREIFINMKNVTMIGEMFKQEVPEMVAEIQITDSWDMLLSYLTKILQNLIRKNKQIKQKDELIEELNKKIKQKENQLENSKSHFYTIELAKNERISQLEQQIKRISLQKQNEIHSSVKFEYELNRQMLDKHDTRKFNYFNDQEQTKSHSELNNKMKTEKRGVEECQGEIERLSLFKIIPQEHRTLFAEFLRKYNVNQKSSQLKFKTGKSNKWLKNQIESSLRLLIVVASPLNKIFGIYVNSCQTQKSKTFAFNFNSDYICKCKENTKLKWVLTDQQMNLWERGIVIEKGSSSSWFYLDQSKLSSNLPGFDPQKLLGQSYFKKSIRVEIEIYSLSS